MCDRNDHRSCKCSEGMNAYLYTRAPPGTPTPCRRSKTLVVAAIRLGSKELQRAIKFYVKLVRRLLQLEIGRLVPELVTGCDSCGICHGHVEGDPSAPISSILWTNPNWLSIRCRCCRIRRDAGSGLSSLQEDGRRAAGWEL